MIPRRLLEFTDHVLPADHRFDLQSVTHLVTGTPIAGDEGGSLKLGTAYLYQNPTALPRARLMGRPIYADSEASAIAALDRFKAELRDRLVVEDPTRPLPEDWRANGRATIRRDLPEYVEIETESQAPAYLVLSDTFDPGWSATVDGRPAPIRPAFVAFRAVYLAAGRHTVRFRYEPAGFRLGLSITVMGVAIAMALVFCKRAAVLEPEHGVSRWPRLWPLAGVAILALIVLLSSFEFDQTGRPVIHPRWARSFHRFTWGAGIEAINPPRSNTDAPVRYGAPQP